MSTQTTQVIRQASETCNKAGIKFTQKRQNVLTALLQSTTPLSAYEIAENYQVNFKEPIPVVSIYRMLTLLAHENLVHKLVSNNKYIVCSHITCKHEHQVPQFLICQKCDTVKEVGINKTTIDALKQTVNQAGFYLASSQLELYCLCQSCHDV